MSERFNGSEIAIVGMAGRFPGASDLAELWRNLERGVESITFLSESELDALGVDEALRADPSYVSAVSLPDDIDRFDANFFDMTAKEAELVDPQHRVLLECAWHALEDAGYDSQSWGGSIGVYAGATINTYLLFNLRSRPEITDRLDLAQINIANGGDFLTTRVSYKLDLKGPSHLVQSACSTSLVAVHVARQALLDEQCDLALAGGVSVNVKLMSGYRAFEGGIVSPDGHCRAFDAKAAGTVFGGGVGVLALKRLEDALADGDTVRAVVLGSAINNDGSAKVGYTAPSVEGQARVIAEALADAGVEAGTIDYVEAHGTGTSLGDPIEILALTRAFGDSAPRPGGCAIGSVKTNLGHLDAAAGVTGLIKTVLALEHRRIPPSLHLERPNPEIGFEETPFYVNAELRDWPAGRGPRRAGVSAFGVGGTNAHVIVEEAPAMAASAPSKPWQLLVLSAKTATALESSTHGLASYLAGDGAAELADVAYTLGVGRRALDHRRMLVCRDAEDAREALDQRPAGRLLDSTREGGAPAVVFLLPGDPLSGGAPSEDAPSADDWVAELYDRQPLFRREIERAAEVLRAEWQLELLAEREEGGGVRRLSLAARCAAQVALGRLWRAWGVEPQAMLGHGAGEYAAACLAGVLSLSDMLRLALARTRSFERQPPAAALSVELREEDVRPLLTGSVLLAAVESPSRCVLTGPPLEMERLRQRLHRDGVTATAGAPAHVTPPLTAAAAGEVAEELGRIALAPPEVPWISGVTGTWISEGEARDPDYWLRHLGAPVRFAEAIDELLGESRRFCLELGPASAMTAVVAEQPGFAGQPVLASLGGSGAEVPGRAALLESVGRLWLAGVTIDWAALYAGERRRRCPLPLYPFERQRYWIEPAERVAVRSPSDTPLPASAAASSRHPRPELATPFVAPASDLERRVAAIWRDALGLERVGVDDSFFDLGGDSLVAVQVMNELKERLGTEVPAVSLYEELTVRALVELLEPDAGAAAAAGDDLESDSRRQRVLRRKEFQRRRRARGRTGRAGADEARGEAPRTALRGGRADDG